MCANYTRAVCRRIDWYIYNLMRTLIRDPDYAFLAVTRFPEAIKLFWGKIFGQVASFVKKKLRGPDQGYQRDDDYANDQIVTRRHQGDQSVYPIYESLLSESKAGVQSLSGPV